MRLLLGLTEKSMHYYKGIEDPAQSSSEQEDQYNAGADSKNARCVLRFPYFNKVWSDLDINLYEDDALDHFPVLSEIWTMLNTEAYNNFPMSPGDSYFWRQLTCCSAEEIYFLDSFFSAANLSRLWRVLEGMDHQCDRQLTNVCVYTVSGHEWDILKNQFEKLRKDGARLEKITFSIYCLKASLAERLHDRFALLGDSLWHFGASAGAMHTNINAYSGPWSDKGAKCRGFMRNIREQRHFVDKVSTVQEEMSL